ncbi:MAG: DUF2061 domain-containing protein [Halobacteriota archaeon]
MSLATRRWHRRRPAEDAVRTLTKAVLYRLLMVAVTVVVAFAVTEDPIAAVNIGLVANVIKTGTYVGYERLWARVRWGTRSGDPA